MNISNGIGSTGLPSELASTKSATAASKTNSGSTESAQAGSGSQVGQGQDQASISSTGGLFSAALNTSDVRMDKIAPIKASIDAGTYNVPSSSVADKMVSSLLE